MRVVIASTFLFLALVFFLGAEGAGIPIPDAAQVRPEDIDRHAARPTLRDPPRVTIGGVEQKCQDCHRLFESLPDAQPELRQHRHIDLDHGLNNRCDNCHLVSDRDKLVLYANKPVGYNQVELLCAKCHGPTYRDWQVGMHGKTTGSWDRSSPEQGHLVCTQCHDPHRPAFPAMVPLPAPDTLRMRPTLATEGHVGLPSRRNPLLHWRSEADVRAENRKREGRSE